MGDEFQNTEESEINNSLESKILNSYSRSIIEFLVLEVFTPLRVNLNS